MTEVDDEILRRWLLRRLDDAALTERLEESLLRDAAFGDRLQAVETDLIDDYVRDRLDPAERAAVERRLFATPRDRGRLRFARALAERVAVQGRARRPRRWRPWALAAAASVLLVFALGGRWRGGADGTATDAHVDADAGLPTVTLLAAVERGEPAAPRVAIVPHGTPRVRLQLELVAAPDAGARYAVRIDGADGPGFEQGGLAARSLGRYRYVEATVPAAALAPGDHRVSLLQAGGASPLQTWRLRTRGE